ncbi:MAG TPA: arginine--tRNA ligase [bacterium (Candidatus Stahlbacteria)]|nr:arginine--tRNA ligase [Candidatus Stahlbacteria bacterium]
MADEWGLKGKVREKLRPIIGCEFGLEFPDAQKFGDLSTPFPLSQAKKKKRNPMEIAEQLKSRIQLPLFREVTATPPGYLNFRLSREYLYEQLVCYHKLDFGSKPRSGRVLIEFVSANPTGPINIVSGRAAALGDVLKRTFNFVGFDAHSEFYINDAGHQTDLFARSLLARVDQLTGKELNIPEDGYPGEYLIPIAEQYRRKYNETDLEKVKGFGISEILKQQKRTLSRFDVHFDHWVNESKMYEEKRVDQVIESLRPYLFEEDGALWFRAVDFGDEKSRVFRTKDDRYTYLVPDLAYHQFKFERGYDLLIDIWGPDHHGHIPKIRAGLKALGAEENRLLILIAQQVNLLSKSKKVAMSKRGGAFVTLDQLLDEIPRDVVRFFFLMRSPSQPLDFDIDLAKERSEKNPVYYVQYAHARICSILKFATGKGIDDWSNAKLSLLSQAEELNLIFEILKFPDIILAVVDKLEPQKLVYYLMGLATTFHKFYERHRVVGEDRTLSCARVFLVDVLRKIIGQGLSLLGVEAPEKM